MAEASPNGGAGFGAEVNSSAAGANPTQGGSSGSVSNSSPSAESLAPDELYAATAACGSSPWIFVSTVRNSRDLGGIPISGGTVTCDRIYRGSQLSTLGVSGCAELSNLGIHTVIDLRTDTEAISAPAYPCVAEQASVVRAPLPTPYSLSPADYIADLHTDASMVAAFSVLADPAAYPVYFHCIYGRDRTGVLAALLLRLLGASDVTIMSEYMRTADAGLGAAPDSLVATLSEIDRVGGAEALLLSVGVSAGTIETVRTLLTTNQ
jgi:protein tyrosine phosphatase (PTP) superfamily phosphohydrolase (DUF442 family)